MRHSSGPRTVHGYVSWRQSREMCVQAPWLSPVWLFATPWTVARQAPLSTGFSRREHWSGLSFPSPGGLPNPGIETESPTLAGRFFTTELPGKPLERWVGAYHEDAACQVRNAEFNGADQGPAEIFRKEQFKGLLWWASGWDSMLPMQGTQVPSLVREQNTARHN